MQRIWLWMAAVCLALAAAAPQLPAGPAMPGELCAVLAGEAAFLDTGTGQMLDLDGIGLAVTSDGTVPAAVERVAVLDLDGDAAVEAVLWVTVNGGVDAGFEILRWDGETVLGYHLPYRGFLELKADGSFRFSGGAGDTGWGRLQFDGRSYAVEEAACSRSGYDAAGNRTLICFVGGQPVSREAFLAEMARQDAKPGAVWHERPAAGG